MKKHVLMLSLLLLVVMGMSTVNAQWVVYDGSVLPENATPAWFEHEGTDGTTLNGTSDLCTVVDDSEITGNKLLKFEELFGDRRETWGTDKENPVIDDPNTGVTVVLRTKPTEDILSAANLNGDNGPQYVYVSIRNGAFREKFNVRWPGVIKLDDSDLVQDFAGYDQWHIFRFTLKNDLVKIYIDEDPTPVFTGITMKSTSDNLIRFGDGSTGRLHGGYYDWVVYDVSGAYAPGEGTVLPAELTGLNTTGVEDEVVIPVSHQLYQNYPNPFNPTTTISFNLAEPGFVSLKIYNITGQLVKTLLSEETSGGFHEFKWNATDDYGRGVSTGIYFYTISTGDFTATKKLTLLK